MTSTGAERHFALGRAHDVSAGVNCDDTHAGVILSYANGTAAWMRERADGEEEWKLLRNRSAQQLAWRSSETRKTKLAAKHAKRAAKATERACIDALPLAEHYSDLKSSDGRIDDLPDQLKKHKLLGTTGLRSSYAPARRTCCSFRYCFSRPTRTRTTSKTAIPASTAAVFGTAAAT
eukprot:6181573-Pleurochrysis_carterae.AAC.1